MTFTIAIDGPAASGKGTISRAVAARFGCAHLDTGTLYRAVGLRMLAGEDPVKAAQALTLADTQRDDLRTPEAAKAASKVAVNPDVRAALVDFQRAFAMREGGAVLDGRDIGTVICPDAHVKLFVTASPEVRAERRFLELSGKGMDVTLEGVMKDVIDRDRRDAERATAPMKPADDAVIIDTSEMDIAAATEAAVKAIAAAQ